MAAEANLSVLKKSRVPPKAGEVFAMRLPSNDYVFGLVIKANVPSGPAPMPGANLIYIYRDINKELNPPLALMRPDRLLLPPIWTNSLAWARGYFQTIRADDLQRFLLLDKHCFFEGLGRKYYDEEGRQIPARIEPCGLWGLVSYRWIDDHVSDAFGIPRVPLSE